MACCRRWSAGAARGETAYPCLEELVGRTYEAVADGDPPPVTAAETRGRGRSGAILASLRG